MAARQAVAKAVDWSQLLQRTTSETRPRILAFKNKSEAIMAANMKAKELDMTIKWDHYQNVVADKALVEDFKKKYEALQIPKPKDTKSAELIEKEKADQITVQKFMEESNNKIGKLRLDLDRLLALPATEQLTMDDVREHFPQTRPDFKKNPYWPHMSQEQYAQWQ